MKIGVPLMLIRNLSPNDGLCNGTRLISQEIRGQFLICCIAGGNKHGNVVYIPRITFTLNELDGFPMEWKRRQFPVRNSFAMTINKSQGQSLGVVGVWLEEPVFSHGDLYVATSRVGNPDNIRYSIKISKDIPSNATKNVVFKEVFNER